MRVANPSFNRARHSAVWAVWLLGVVLGGLAFAQPAGEIAYVSASALNVRVGPGTEHEIVGRIARGEQVTAYERQGDWTRIEARSARISGWGSSRYLSSALPPAPSLSDSAIRQRLIRESVAGYSGSCPCPYNTDRAGRRCGGRSAYSRPGGASPLCYPSDVSAEQVRRYRERMGD